MLKLSGSGVTQWAGAVAVLVATAGHAAAFSVPVHSPLCNPMAGATRPSLVRMTRAPSDELYALPLRCGFATALSSMLPLAVQAEEVTAFKASGAADALGSLEIGVLIVGLLAPAYVIWRQSQGLDPDPNTPEGREYYVNKLNKKK